jgi:hypothetical protein
MTAPAVILPEGARVTTGGVILGGKRRPVNVV